MVGAGLGLGVQGTERKARLQLSVRVWICLLLVLLVFLSPGFHKCLGISRLLRVLAQLGLSLAPCRPSPVYLCFVTCAPASLGLAGRWQSPGTVTSHEKQLQGVDPQLAQSWSLGADPLRVRPQN